MTGVAYSPILEVNREVNERKNGERCCESGKKSISNARGSVEGKDRRAMKIKNAKNQVGRGVNGWKSGKGFLAETVKAERRNS